MVKEYDGQRKTDSGIVSMLHYTDLTNDVLWESVPGHPHNILELGRVADLDVES